MIIENATAHSNAMPVSGQVPNCPPVFASGVAVDWMIGVS